MTTIDPAIDRSRDPQVDACAVDGTCADSGCGCAPTAEPDTVALTRSRRGFTAALLAVACVLGCLAVPVVIGGAAAVSGVVAGEWWLVLGVAVAAMVVGVAVLRRRHRTGRLC